MVGRIEDRMPTERFADLGMDTLVYIRTLSINGQRLHVIHAADGTPLSVVPDRDAALATIAHYDLKPLSVH